MEIKWKILIALICLWMTASFMVDDGRNYCMDGTTTNSTGRGTCSHHGGKGVQPEKKPFLYAFIVGVGIWGWYFYWRKNDRQSHINTRHSLNPPSIEEKQLSSIRQKIHADPTVPRKYVAPVAVVSNKEEKLAFSKEIILINSAISTGETIQFVYKKPNQKKYYLRVINPIRIHSIPHSYGDGNTLCVLGICQLRKEERNFALKRMKKLALV